MTNGVVDELFGGGERWNDADLEINRDNHSFLTRGSGDGDLHQGAVRVSSLSSAWL